MRCRSALVAIRRSTTSTSSRLVPVSPSLLYPSLQAMDLYWHEDCLKCGCCDARLGEVGQSLYTKGNLLLCKRDYLRSGPQDRPPNSPPPPSFQALRLNGLLRGLQEDHPGIRDGDEGQNQRLSPGVLRLPGVRPQVLCGGPVLPVRQQGAVWC